jgi:predicted metal-dependent hydrolase
MGSANLVLDLDGIRIPLKVIVEKRNGARVSLGGKHVILRVPVQLFGSDYTQHVAWACNWLKELKIAKPGILERYLEKKPYTDGDVFSIGGQHFLLEITENDTPNGIIKLMHEGVLRVTLPSKTGYNRQKLIKNLLIRFSQRYFLADMHQRVHYFNDRYFQKEIESIRLKYNTSNWGSCSTGKNLNFSVRLYLAPDEVVNYVVIHELAHLVEMNHSPRFWKIVSDIMPDFREKEKMLKANSAVYDF